MVKFLCDWQRVIHVDFFDRCQNSQCSLLLRPGKRRERKDPIQAEDRWKAGSLQYIARPHMAKTSMETSEIEMEPSDTSTVVPIWPLVISTCSEGSNQTCKACGLRTVREWIRRQKQAFFEKGIRMLPDRWKNCVDSGGEYVED